ncbi:hypothetical protein [Streptomyces phaeochromogenes]
MIDISETVPAKPASKYLDDLFATGSVPAHNAGGDAAVPDSDFSDERVFTVTD